MIRFCTALLVVGLCALPALSVPPPSQFVSGSDYSDTYVTTGYVKNTTQVTGGGTATFSGFWDARRDCKSQWSGVDGSRLYINAGAEFDNNFYNVLYASNFQIDGDPNNTGSANEIFEFDAGFDADRGDGSISIGDVLDSSYVGGMTTMRVHNARLVTHASQNLATAFKATTDTGAWNPTGAMLTSHHGLLIFADIMSTGDAATCSEWHVRSNDQTYDGGLYWRNDWTLDVESGVILSSNTHFEQAAVGPHVGFGTRAGYTNTTLTKTGDGALVIARGGIQGYETGTMLDIQAGRVEFNSNEATNRPNYYCGGNGQTLQIQVAAGAEVDFHAYSYPIENNWYTSSSYGPESTHEVKSLDAAGTVKLGGLWSPSSDQWDTDYYNLFEAGTASPTGYGPALQAETANAGDAVLDVSDNLTLYGTSDFQILLNSDTGSTKVTVGGTAAVAGGLDLSLDSSYAPSFGDVFTLFDAGTLAGQFATVAGVSIDGGDKALAVTYDTGADEVLAEVALPGDATLDGAVDVSDLSLLGANYGTGSGAVWAIGDFTGDGVIDVSDLSVLGANYNRAYISTVVPEPATLAMLGIGSLAVLLRRKRR
ncbi:MAG: PEP-CTERM sorting domain-containing protein [Phycisphaerae bacterium]